MNEINSHGMSSALRRVINEFEPARSELRANRVEFALFETKRQMMDPGSALLNKSSDGSLGVQDLQKFQTRRLTREIKKMGSHPLIGNVFGPSDG